MELLVILQLEEELLAVWQVVYQGLIWGKGGGGGGAGKGGICPPPLDPECPPLDCEFIFPHSLVVP